MENSENIFDFVDYHLAIPGDCFRWLIREGPPELVRKVLRQCQIYTRMSPDEKSELVKQLKNQEYCVAMIGDGANDCSALKIADVGLSLSEAEASVAAPFTSNTGSIYCLLNLMREGRCSLTTSFGCFKFIVMYSLIQFFTMTLLYSFAGTLGNYQFLFIDLVLIVPLAVMLARTTSFDKLSARRPSSELFSKRVLASLFGQVAIAILVQLLTLRLIRQQTLYVNTNC